MKRDAWGRKRSRKNMERKWWAHVIVLLRRLQRRFRVYNEIGTG